MTTLSHYQERKRKRNDEDVHELESPSQRRTPPSLNITTSVTVPVDTYTPVHKLEGSNALASTSAVFLVSDSPGYPELDNVTARDSVLKNPDLMAKTFSHLKAMDLDYGSHDLFNAALTCKDFLDVALDAL